MSAGDSKNASSSAVNQVGPARGVLKVEEPAGQFQHWRLAAPASIAPLVQHIWVVRWSMAEGASHLAKTLPYPNVHLIVEQGTAEIYGVHHGRFTRKLAGTGGAVGVKFRPGGFYPFLKKSMSSLRNRSVPVESVLGASARDYGRALGDLSISEHDILAIVESFLTRHWPATDRNVDRVADLVSAIERDRTILQVEHVIAQHRLTKRSLQRLFEQYVGIGPKWVINRFRIHEVIERLHGGEPIDWAAFALELGYFDQAHFNREFKALIGCTPKQYAANS